MLALNSHLAATVNEEILFETSDLSRHLLAGAFHSLFRVERESEIAESVVFPLDGDPSGLDGRRLDAVHLRHLPFFLANEELYQRRFVSHTEYRFVLLVDVSRSLTGGWFESLSGATDSWREHPTFRLKYLACALLKAAVAAGFESRVLLLDQLGTQPVPAGPALDLPVDTLECIDRHLLERPDGPRPTAPPWLATLEELARLSTPIVIALISDLLDPLQAGVPRGPFIELLAELRQLHRLLVLQVNRERDVSHSSGASLREHDYYDGERGSTISLKAEDLIVRHNQSRAWLGGRPSEPLVGTLGAALSRHGIPHQRFLSGAQLRHDLENLVNRVALES